MNRRVAQGRQNVKEIPVSLASCRTPRTERFLGQSTCRNVASRCNCSCRRSLPSWRIRIVSRPTSHSRCPIFTQVRQEEAEQWLCVNGWSDLAGPAFCLQLLDVKAHRSLGNTSQQPRGSGGRGLFISVSHDGTPVEWQSTTAMDAGSTGGGALGAMPGASGGGNDGGEGST